MKTLNGYSKERYTDDYVLLAGYGTKSISDFVLIKGSVTDLDSGCTLNGIYVHNDTATGRPNNTGYYGNIFNISNKRTCSPGTDGHWIQLLDFTHDGTIWHRQRINTGSWTAWEKILTTANWTGIIDGRYLLLSGGTMTGALTVPSLSVTGAATFSQAINASILGNAATASRLGHTLTFTGYSTGTFDGSADKSIAIPSNTNQLTNGAGFITSSSNITGTAAGITGYTFKTASSVCASGWTNGSTDNKIIPTMSFVAYWNGAYSGTSSNLAYCNKGAFGTACTHAHTDYVTVAGAQTISGNKTFSSSVSIDDLTVGNLVVSGNASFSLTINGNAATASILQNARTIWGLSFDGSSNIASDLVMPNGKSIIWYDSSSTPRTAMALNAYNLLTIGYGTSGAGYNTELNGNNIYLKTGTGHTTALTINDSQQATFAGMINTIAAQATEGSTLAATTAGINMNNSNLKGLNGIYFADEANVINEGIHFVRGDQTNKVDTLLSYRGNLYYRTNRELGTTKDDTATTSANIIVHSGNVGSYHQKHTVSRFISGNGTTDNSNIYYSGTSMNGYWLGDLEYTGQTLTYGYPTNNSTKYTFTTTNKSDIVIIDTEDWAQIFLSVNKPAGTVIDIYTCANTHLNFKVMASYSGTTRKVIISYADSYTVCTESNYSNIYYWWYNTSVNSGTPPGTADYPRAKCLWFDIINRGVVRVVYTGTDIYIFKLCAFPA